MYLLQNELFLIFLGYPAIKPFKHTSYHLESCETSISKFILLSQRKKLLFKPYIEVSFTFLLKVSGLMLLFTKKS